MAEPDKGAEADLARIIERNGADFVRDYVRKVERSKSRELTIIVNLGMHAIPSEILRGDVFAFSEGQVNLSAESIDEIVDELVLRAHSYLSKKNWNKVYIIPSGHPMLVVLATLVAFRATRIDPTIVAYFGVENYVDVDANVRERIFRSRDHSEL
jgi:hypothetical protein